MSSPINKSYSPATSLDLHFCIFHSTMITIQKCSFKIYVRACLFFLLNRVIEIFRRKEGRRYVQ